MTSQALSATADTAVRALMTSPVKTAHRDMTLAEVKKVFDRYDINHLPVVDADERVLGIISSTDLARITNWKAYFQPEREAANLQRLLETLLVEDVMHKPAVTARDTATLLDIATLVNERRFHCVPIVDAERVLVGVITAHDLLRAAYPGS